MLKFNVGKIILTKPQELDKEWDVIIVGAGPAGLSAAIYSARYGLKTLVIAPEIGGMLEEAAIIENYPGFIKISGPDLAKKFKEHAIESGAKILEDSVTKIEKMEDKFKVHTSGGYEFLTKAVILATGSSRRKLNVEGENLSGVSYCAECDAPLFKDKVVAVVGGGNTAFHDALVLSEHARKVYIIHRRDKFRAESALVNAAKRKDNIEILTNKVVSRIVGKNSVEKVILKDTVSGKESELEVNGVFIAIGMVPNTELAKQLGVKLDEKGFIIVDKCQRTNVPGVYAAGNITTNCCYFDQIITSAAQGAIAAKSAYEDLMEK